MLMHGERFARRSEDLPGDNDPHEPVSQDVSTMRPRLCLALRTHSPFTMSKIIRSAAANLKLVHVRRYRTELPSPQRVEALERTGGAYRDRTDDPLLAKQVLSQLS